MLSKEEWKTVEQASTTLYTYAKLMVDGYELTLTLCRISTYRNAITVYVNGEIQGAWLTEECEERRRFFRTEKRSLWTRKELEQIKKMPKKKREEYLKRGEYVTYAPYWTSFDALRRHLVKHNQDITIKQIGGGNYGTKD